MKHHIMRCRGVAVVGLDGEFTMADAPQTRQLLLTALKREPNLVVLLGDVTRMDSAGSAVLVEALHASRQGGGRLALSALSEDVLHVLQLAKLDQVFSLFAGLDDALNWIKDAP